MPVHFRRYFQMVEKRSADVNPIWKVFHAFLFIVIVVMSFLAAFTFHDIFDSFNFHCILYAKPVLRLDNIKYYSASTSAPSNDSALNTTSTIVVGTFRHYNSSCKNRPQCYSKGRDIVSDHNDSTIDDVSTTTRAVVETTPNVTHKNGTTFVITNDFYWVTNSTLTARLVVDYRHTVFGARRVCNSVLFFPLATMVLGTFVAVIVMICGRGGKGYASDLFPKPWLYVYPLLAFSLIMLIINCVMASYLSKGMKQFCAGFSYYTGQTNCSEKINYFMDEAGFGVFNLYQTYRLCLISFCAGIMMWSLQVLLVIFRVICIADFELKMVKVSSKRRFSVEYDDPVNQFLMDSYKDMRKVTLVREYNYDKEIWAASIAKIPKYRYRKRPSTRKVTFFDEQAPEESPSSSDVHEALTKNHKLRKVPFDDNKSKKEDEDGHETQV